MNIMFAIMTTLIIAFLMVYTFFAISVQWLKWFFIIGLFALAVVNFKAYFIYK